jgi:hypothetical protein
MISKISCSLAVYEVREIAPGTEDKVLIILANERLGGYDVYTSALGPKRHIYISPDLVIGVCED